MGDMDILKIDNKYLNIGQILLIEEHYDYNMWTYNTNSFNANTNRLSKIYFSKDFYLVVNSSPEDLVEQIKKLTWNSKLEKILP